MERRRQEGGGEFGFEKFADNFKKLFSSSNIPKNTKHFWSLQSHFFILFYFILFLLNILNQFISTKMKTNDFKGIFALKLIYNIFNRELKNIQ